MHRMDKKKVHGSHWELVPALHVTTEHIPALTIFSICCVALSIAPNSSVVYLAATYMAPTLSIY